MASTSLNTSQTHASPLGLFAGHIPPDASSLAVLEHAREAGSARALGYAGDVTPQEAFDLLAAGAARLVDVRTPEERKFVGYVPESVPVPWATGTTFQKNPRFLRELEGKVGKDDVILLICRSGQRSAAAAQAATRAQFKNAFSVLEGFEGELDVQGRRNASGGWKFRSLPWVQD
jgi:rhodanese-related sulfurtransferase